MLLAIDTSGPFCSCALFDVSVGKVVEERSENLGRGHAERLMAMLEETLNCAELSWPDITRLAVVIGPGSFTGLRVGLATARGLALALKIPCQGISVFEGFAGEFGKGKALAVVMDAKRDQVWMQCFDKAGLAITEPRSCSPEEAGMEIPANITRIAGCGASLLVGDFETIDDAPSPPISAVARVAASLEVLDEKPRPLYLRAPDAKFQTPLPRVG